METMTEGGVSKGDSTSICAYARDRGIMPRCKEPLGR